MRRLIALAALVAASLLVLLWLSGGFGVLAQWAKAGQRDFQNAMAAPLRHLKAGEAGAILTLLALSFGYGFVHAAGPGHGKVLLGGYALATRTGMAKLVGLSLAASLAQATVAVLLVFAGVFAAGWGRDQMKGAAEAWFAPASALTIGALGLWLAVRGVRHLRQTAAHPRRKDPHDSHHHADHHLAATSAAANCAHCGHAHGPTLAEAERVSDWRTAAALIGGVAIRPCTGALFVLFLTWQMGISGAGIAAAYAMGLGTALVTIAAALAAALLREGLMAGLAGGPALGRVLSVLEIGAGLFIALVATTLAFGPL